MTEETIHFFRPKGVTFVCWLIGFIGLWSIVTALLELTGSNPSRSYELPVAYLGFSLVALVALTGLWKMKRWGLNAYIVLVLTDIFTSIYHLLDMGDGWGDLQGSGSPGPFVFACFSYLFGSAIMIGIGAYLWQKIPGSVETNDS